MAELNLQTFRFRGVNGDVIVVPAQDEQAARSIAMEQRHGPPQYNRTWICDRWDGLGLRLIDEQGLPIMEAPRG